jgi:hypothetical protein
VRHPRRSPSKTERRLALALLASLALIVALVLGSRAAQDPFPYLPPELTARPAAAAASVDTPDLLPTADLPEGWSALAPPTRYDASSLYQKINGKADLYLSADFASLSCQRYGPGVELAMAVEVSLYRMGDAEGAFAVYSRQRREGARPLSLTRHAYATANAVFLAHGPVYAELVSGDLSGGLRAPLEALARAVVARLPALTGATERSLLPTAGQIEASVKVYPDSAFGFAGLDQVHTARFHLEGLEEQPTAFATRRSGAAEARALAEAYGRFLTTNGARQVQPAGAEGLLVYEVFGMTEVLLVVDDVLAGVHQADDGAAALTLTRALRAWLSGGAP